MHLRYSLNFFYVACDSMEKIEITEKVSGEKKL